MQVGAGNAFLSHFSFIPIDRVTVKRVLQGWLILRLFCPIARSISAVSISFYSNREGNFIGCSVILQYRRIPLRCSNSTFLLIDHSIGIDPITFVIWFSTFNLSLVSPISRLYSKNLLFKYPDVSKILGIFSKFYWNRIGIEWRDLIGLSNLQIFRWSE